MEDVERIDWWKKEIYEIEPISCELSESMKFIIDIQEKSTKALHEALIIPKEYL